MSARIVGPADAREAADRIRASTRVAVDTEFHAENRYLPDLYLVQLGLDDGTCLIVDPLVAGVLDPVGAALLERPWVVHAGDHDLRLLTAVLGARPTGPVLDTQIAAGLCTPTYPAGYATLCEGWLGVRVDKGETLSDWSRRPLSAAQLAYAAADVRHLFALADILSARVEALGRASALRAACAEAAEAAVDPSPERWLADLGATATLEPRQGAVLRALLSWRDDRARLQNQPARVIASDAILVDVARRLPTDAASLTTSRRFPKNVARHAPDLVAIVAQALETPEASWPRLARRGTAAARRSAFLHLWAQVRGEQASWSPALVLPPRVADQVAIDGAAALSPWRRDVLGGDVDAVAAGAISLRIRGDDLSEG